KIFYAANRKANPYHEAPPTLETGFVPPARTPALEKTETMIPLTPVTDSGPVPVDSETVSKLRVALVRGPLVSTVRAANNEATPCIGLAYVAGYLRPHGYHVTIVDSIGEGLNRYWALDEHPGYVCQGLP